MLTAVQARDIYGHLHVIEKDADNKKILRREGIEGLVAILQEELDKIKAILGHIDQTPLEAALTRAEGLLQWSPKQIKAKEILCPPTLHNCVRAILDTITVGDLFDCAAGDLAEARGFFYPDPDQELDEVTKHAYDQAFFDVLDEVMIELRNTWGGYNGTLKSPKQD